MKIYSKIFNSVLLLIIFSCQRNEIIPILPTLATSNVSEITVSSFRLSSAITDIGNQSISDYGFVYSETNASPTLADSKISHGAVSVANVTSLKFSDVVQGLKPNTNYYARSYTTVASETILGLTITFKTLAIIQPTVKTLAANTTSTTSVKIEGLAELGGNSDNITEYGICWSERFTTPTIEHSKAKILENISVFPKTFTVDIYSLNANSNLYYRAYIVSNGVVSYGEIKTYKLEIEDFPTITTGNATLISANSQRIQGVINTKGKYAITEYGVCWNLINDFSNTLPLTCKTGASIQGSPTVFPAPFSINAVNLNVGTLYQYRVFVIANGITTYGNEKSFFHTGTSK